jgi:hypothetical protein
MAAAILDEVAAGELSIHPDSMSSNVFRLWREDPAALEVRIAAVG